MKGEVGEHGKADESTDRRTERRWRNEEDRIVNMFYTLDGAYITRDIALAALRANARAWCALRGETRTYVTNMGKLTVWVWPF